MWHAVKDVQKLFFNVSLDSLPMHVKEQLRKREVVKLIVETEFNESRKNNAYVKLLLVLPCEHQHILTVN